MKPLIIVSGLGCTGYKIYNLLKQQGANVIGISDRAAPLRDRAMTTQIDDNIIMGDLRSPQVLIQAGIKKAYCLG